MEMYINYLTNETYRRTRLLKFIAEQKQKTKTTKKTHTHSQNGKVAKKSKMKIAKKLKKIINVNDKMPVVSSK